ncbi:MAG: phosphatase PAP2 family protein, partial [Sedimentisphaerales bacterium]|nr:phosphatase PAP2 family protein [Sedimentisphaerales bacterium]
AVKDLSETSGYVLELAREDVNDWRNWPKRIIKDSKESFLRTDNLCILLLAGGASVVLHTSDADKKVAENFDDNHIFHGFTDESLNVIGHPWTQFGASVLWYAVSRKNQDDFNKERAKAMVAALSVTGVATFSLKAIRNNESPNGKDWAWPSGHTASSFTIASMLDEYYGPKIGIPAYALASLVAYRMLDTGDHWTSDVVFGAAIGWVVGHTFGDRQTQLEIAGFDVLPYTVPTENGNTAMGIGLVKQF